MSRPSVVGLRLLAVSSLLFAMPLLAMPSFNRRLNEWLRPETTLWPRREGFRRAVLPSGSVRAESRSFALPRGNRPAASPGRIPGESWQPFSEDLRRCGASELQLTRIDGDDRYRFECEVPLPGHPIYRRRFAAESATAGGAVQAVCEQVRRWLQRREALESEGASSSRSSCRTSDMVYS